MKLDHSLIKAAALDLLARREHSRCELKRKLQKRFGAVDVIELILDELTAADWLNESRFVEAYIRWRARRGFGPFHIRQSLLQRGVPNTLIDEFLFTLPDIDWQENAEAVRAKKFGAAEPSDYQERAQQLKFLYYRGFNE